MSFSIDGKIYKSKQIVKYGQEFPKPNRSREVYQPNFGKCLIYIISTGVPEWEKGMSVVVPVRFYITQIIEPNKEYRTNQKRKENNLQLVKG